MFRNRDLSVIAYANGFTLWHFYAKDDTFEEVSAKDYFKEVAALCNNGDKILVSSSTWYAELIVSKITLAPYGVEAKLLNKVVYDG